MKKIISMFLALTFVMAAMTVPASAYVNYNPSNDAWWGPNPYVAGAFDHFIDEAEYTDFIASGKTYEDWQTDNGRYPLPRASLADLEAHYTNGLPPEQVALYKRQRSERMKEWYDALIENGLTPSDAAMAEIKAMGYDGLINGTDATANPVETMTVITVSEQTANVTATPQPTPVTPPAPAASTNVTVLEASPLGDFAFYKDRDGEIVCSYRGPGGDIVIPNGVTKVDLYGEFDKTVTGIVIPDSATSIAYHSLGNYGSLTRVDVGENVASVGKDSFGNCPKLTDVTFRNPNTELGENLFLVWPDGKVSKNLTIHGIAGSTAEAYAKANGIRFVADVTGKVTVKNTAYASTQTVLVDGRPVTFNAYATKDANGNMTNYVKLRDIAYALNGTNAQFNVEWDGDIVLASKTAYVANGSEMVKNFDGDQVYTPNLADVKVNNRNTGMTAFTLTDAAGGAYNYFKLRDIGIFLNFDVSWADGKIVIDTTKPYAFE